MILLSRKKVPRIICLNFCYTTTIIFPHPPFLKALFCFRVLTVWMEAIRVATTSIVVSVTIIRLVKSSKSKKNDKYPMKRRMAIWRKVLDRWYSIRRRNIIFTSTLVPFFVIWITSSRISNSVNPRSPATPKTVQLSFEIDGLLYLIRQIFLPFCILTLNKFEMFQFCLADLKQTTESQKLDCRPKIVFPPSLITRFTKVKTELTFLYKKYT